MRGTPFLVDKWYKGIVNTPAGAYKNLELKYNVYENTIFFNKDDYSYELTDNIVSFTLMPNPDDPKTYMVYRKGLASADFKDNQFIMVLLEGTPASVYRLDEKQVHELSEVNAGIVKTFKNNNKYYINVNKQLQFVKLNKAEILAVLKDKQDKLEQFIADKKLSFKKENDLVELVKYYNTL